MYITICITKTSIRQHGKKKSLIENKSSKNDGTNINIKIRPKHKLKGNLIITVDISSVENNHSL